MSQQSRTNNLRIPDRDVGNPRQVDVIEDFFPKFPSSTKLMAIYLVRSSTDQFINDNRFKL